MLTVKKKERRRLKWLAENELLEVYELFKLKSNNNKNENEVWAYFEFLKILYNYKFNKRIIKRHSHMLMKLKSSILAFCNYLEFLKGRKKEFYRSYGRTHNDFIMFLQLYRPDLVEKYNTMYLNAKILSLIERRR